MEFKCPCCNEKMELDEEERYFLQQISMESVRKQCGSCHSVCDVSMKSYN